MDGNHDPKVEKRAPSKLIPVAFILMFLAGAGFGFLRSTFFLVSDIEIRGLKTLSPEEVMTVVGHIKNENIFDADLMAITKRVKTNPIVDKVRVIRKLPSTLVVEVTERAAVAVIPYSGYYVLVDTEGLAIGMVESYRAKDLPLITGLKPQQVLVGKLIDVQELSFALLVATLLPQDIVTEISEINYAETTGISTYLQSGTWVALGLGTRQEYITRLEVLDSLLTKLKEENRHATYIDVRFPKRPVVRDRK